MFKLTLLYGIMLPMTYVEYYPWKCQKIGYLSKLLTEKGAETLCSQNILVGSIG